MGGPLVLVPGSHAPGYVGKGRLPSLLPGRGPDRVRLQARVRREPPYKSGLVELKVEGSRITGLGTGRDLHQGERGFRPTGLWMMDNVDLTVTKESAAPSKRVTRPVAPGRYVTASVPPLAVQISGEAANLETRSSRRSRSRPWRSAGASTRFP